jgi:hypothetical protein
MRQGGQDARHHRHAKDRRPARGHLAALADVPNRTRWDDALERITLEGPFQSGAAGVKTNGRHGMTSCARRHTLAAAVTPARKRVRRRIGILGAGGVGRAGDIGRRRRDARVRALVVRLPQGGFVWNRPTAVTVERAGAVRHLRVVDVPASCSWHCSPSQRLSPPPPAGRTPNGGSRVTDSKGDRVVIAQQDQAAATSTGDLVGSHRIEGQQLAR